MADVLADYDRKSFDKLETMFDGDPRKGNAELYVRQHFDLQRRCPNCGSRTAHRGVAIPSVIVSGDSWVVPLSVYTDGRIELDLAKSIPDQSNFLRADAIAGLRDLGIALNLSGRTEYVIPILESRDAYYKTLRQNKRWDYKNTRRHFTCEVVADATPFDVLRWDAEVEYDYEEHPMATPGDRSCGFNVEIEYFSWLAENGKLLVGRVSEKNGPTVAMGYCVPTDYELAFVTLKRRSQIRYRKYGLGTALFFMFLDYIYDNGLTTR